MLKIIKIQLEGEKGTWPEELPNVRWAYRTMARVPTRETPFKLTFGSEAVILVEVGLTIIRVGTYEKQKNQQELNSNLELIDEVRHEVQQRMTRYKGAMARYYNKKG